MLIAPEEHLSAYNALVMIWEQRQRRFKASNQAQAMWIYRKRQANQPANKILHP
jgi:hypothetical protein